MLPLSEWSREQLIAHLVLHDWVPVLEPAYYALVRTDGLRVSKYRSGTYPQPAGHTEEEPRVKYFAWITRSFGIYPGEFEGFPDEVLRELTNYIREKLHAT